MTVDARLAGNQPQIGRGIGAIGDHRVTAIAAEPVEPRELGAVPVEDRGAARRQKGGEEAVLGGPVMRHIAVVIEVVARQVSKRRGGDRHAIEPELVEAVARRLDRHVIDPLFGQPGEIAVQRDRIGGRQRAGPVLGRRSPVPSVPRLAAGWPSAVQISRVKWTTEVLPLVPVTAAIVRGCRP